MKAKFPLVGGIALALFSVSPLLALRVNPTDYEGGRSRDAGERMVRNTSAVATMLGEFRTSFGDLLFVKTERYLDSGVAYLPHVDVAEMSVEGETAELQEHQAELGEHDAATCTEHEHEHGHAHTEEHGGEEFAGTPTVIRTPENDFRGFIGWLQREVKPWRDPRLGHEHTDGTELLPWYRVMTAADPHNVRGYAIGGWWLAERNSDEAIAFVREGVENNPESFQLHHILGRVLYDKAERMLASSESANVTALVTEAQRVFNRAVALALRNRPAGWIDGMEARGWNSAMEEDALAAARFEVLLEERFGDVERADAMARHYMSVFGADAVLERHLQTHDHDHTH